MELSKDQGILINVRHNILNGNEKDARELIREYGESDFFFNYAQYLESLDIGSDAILDELGMVLANFKFIN